MSKPAPAPTSKWLAPIKPGFIASARRAAESIGWNVDELAQQMFSRALDRLTVEEGFKLHGRIDVEIDERRRGPQSDGPHDVTCISCEAVYRCFCNRQHKQGECHYCHNNTTESAERRRVWHNGF